MIEMNECILHVLDTEKNLCVFAEETIPEMEPEIEKLRKIKFRRPLPATISSMVISRQTVQLNKESMITWADSAALWNCPD